MRIITLCIRKVSLTTIPMGRGTGLVSVGGGIQHQERVIFSRSKG